MGLVVHTTIGAILGKYNSDIDDFDMFRVVDIKDEKYFIKKIDSKKYHFVEDAEVLEKTPKEVADYTFIEPDAALTISNVNMFTNDKGKVFRDIIMMMFTPDEEGHIEFANTKILARQLMDDPFESNGTKPPAGFCYSADDIEATDGLINDLLYSESLISKKIICMYKTDNLDDIANLLDNEDTTDIFNDLYEHCYVPYKDKGDYGNGICKDLKSFIRNKGVLYDARAALGISYIDLDFTGKTSLDRDTNLLLSLLYSVRVIDRTLVTEFTYEIDISEIKMRYLLVYDETDTLYVVAYTTSKDEILKSDLEEMNKKTDELYQHLRKIASKIAPETDR